MNAHTPESEASRPTNRVFDWPLLARLWRAIAPHQALIWMALSLLMLNSACRLAQPYLIKLAIDDHLLSASMEGFWLLITGFGLIAILELIFRRWQIYLIDKAGQNSLYDLRLSIFQHLQRLPASFFDRSPTGKLIGRVTTDVEALQEMFSSGVVTILGDFVFLAATVGILLSLNWKLTLITLLAVPVLLVVTLFIRTRVRTAYVELRSRLSQMNAFLHEQVSGMPVLQMFGREARARKSYHDINIGVQAAQLTTVWWESILSAITEMIGSFTAALILWYGSRIAFEAETDTDPLTTGLTLGTLFAFIDYMQKFFSPLADLSQKYTVMQNAMTASRRIFELLDVEERIPETANPVNAGPTRGEVVFENVRFAYRGQEPVLKNLSLCVKPGERVAVVGATGAGKTTLMKLLTRLYDVDAGRILLDGIDIRDYPLQDLRRRIAIVPQDVFLFEGDILANIRLGHPEISPEQAIAAAERLHLDQFIQRFPGRYREPVRERGKNLSAGEKQLISFARVLAVAPPLLILDEATSNVDSHTEELLQDAVHELMEGRTALIIAHRLSTIRDADRILVLHRGELVEEGTHEDLLALRGTYWRLYQLQYQLENRAS